MPKLAANLSWIYQEVPFLQRFGAAAAHGFKAVEILFPYEAPAADIAAELKKHTLTPCSTCRPVTGAKASAASPPCPVASPSLPPPSRRHSTTPRCWSAAPCT